MKVLLRFLIRIVLILVSFLFVFNLPSLLGIGKDRVQLNVHTFWSYVSSDFQSLITVNNPEYWEFLQTVDLAESYRYTMAILLLSLLLVTILSVGIAVVVIVSPPKLRNLLKTIINFFEGVPDLLIIFLFMFLVVTLYKTTGLKFLQLYGVFGKKPYFVPIMTVSFLPFFLMLQFLLKVISDEEGQPYVEYARAKGIGQVRVLIVHIFRHIFPLAIFQLRTIVWVLLSNIYLVESIFNINGFNQQLLNIISFGGNITTLVIFLLMLTIPLLTIESIGWLLSRTVKGKEEASI
ncbi:MULTISPECIES: ABC transporter permease subunit [unclassified Bacillus (in: firmicutes)]|uniref:ABC transporter permease subunit n=1 Tax=unclassified Bacillus (in: firmicutes) TaxID=185979 RepID=UPI001596D97D|nr:MULTISPECIES: ABC transporter permease subunit [unclassified Bacillus (in: firmicutes)]